MTDRVSFVDRGTPIFLMIAHRAGYRTVVSENGIFKVMIELKRPIIYADDGESQKLTDKISMSEKGGGRSINNSFVGATHYSRQTSRCSWWRNNNDDVRSSFYLFGSNSRAWLPGNWGVHLLQSIIDWRVDDWLFVDLKETNVRWRSCPSFRENGRVVHGWVIDMSLMIDDWWWSELSQSVRIQGRYFVQVSISLQLNIASFPWIVNTHERVIDCIHDWWRLWINILTRMIDCGKWTNCTLNGE